MAPRAQVFTKPKVSSFSRWTFLVIVNSVIGIVLSFVLYHKVMEWQVRLFAAEFQLRAETHARDLQEGFNHSLARVEEIADFYASSVDVTKNEFRKFVSGYLADHPGIHALGWVQPVSGPDRRAFEAAFRTEEGPTFRITERGPGRKIISAGSRSSYDPLVRVEPSAIHEKMIGFDLASDPVIAASLVAARDRGRMTIVTRTPLTNFGEHNGFFAIQPLYASTPSHAGNEAQRKNLKGFALGVFQLGDVFEEVLRGTEKLGVNYKIIEVEEGGGKTILYTHASRTRKESKGSLRPGGLPVLLKKLFRRTPLSVPGRRWDLVAYPAPALLATFHPYEARAALFSGLLCTGFVSVLLILVARRYVQRERYLGNLSRVNQQLQKEIDERTRSDHALKESEEKFRALFDSAADGVLLLQLEGGEPTIIDCNPRVLELFGAVREEIVGKRPDDLSPGIQPDGVSSREKSKTMIRAALAGDCPVFEWRHRRLDGGLFDAEINLQRLRLKGRDYIQGIIRDITLRKKMEQELLKQEKLESLGLLAGGLAHDFNNLLTVILGNLSLAQYQSSTDEHVKGLIMDAEKATLRARELTQQLLTFAKGGAPVIRTTTVEKVVRESTAFALRGSNVRSEMSFPGGLAAVEIDEGQIGQVIHNLVLNAEQAMPDGGVLRISCKNVRLSHGKHVPLPEGDYVRIDVTDEGTGIPMEYQQRVFDPYFTTKQKGSGLGLAGSYSIIQRHKGHLSVYSSPGHGSTFSIYLPASSNVPEKAEEERLAPLRGTGRILVMDDEPSIRRVAGEILKHLGYRVEGAKDGEEAIELYSKAFESGDPFRVAILDLTIPGGMGGKEVIGKLLNIDPQIKAIVSSGYADDPIMADYRSYGFASVAAKPYQLATLSEAVSHALEAER
ncbi:MAG: PAS domain S-box protein [Deltaproteobacteria bacterium]|nr:PAS domain S-box protein [Deltaproteobacteria bacterium]